MLELTTTLPAIGPTTPTPSGAAAGAGSGAPEPFARVLAGMSTETSPGAYRQDFAAPGKTLPAALPPATLAPGGDAVAAKELTPVSRVLTGKSVPAGPAPLLPDLRTDLPPVAEAAPPAQPIDEQDETELSPGPASAGVVTIAAPIPILLTLNEAVVDAPPPTPPITLVGPGAVAPLAADKEAAPIGDPTLSIAGTDAKPPVSRRLSLKLDPAIEVVDGGTPRATPAADQPRPALRFAVAEPALTLPLAVKPDAVAVAGVPVPAAHAFAHAIAQAVRRNDARDDARDGATAIDPTDITTTASAIAVADARPVVTAPRALDMAREDWPQRLIDRIEAARDAANAGDTRIRLVPEALGKIDIALRQDGATLHIQFTAEQAATRELLASAQSRLADLAEARGLRLGQTGVDGGPSSGNSNGEQGRRPPPALAPLANRPASDLRAEMTPSGSASRIA